MRDMSLYPQLISYLKLKIKAEDIRNFIQGNLLHASKDFLPDYMKEQAEYRAWLCRSCLVKKKCPHCSCKVPNMFYAPKKVCKLNKWGPFLSKNEWEIQRSKLPYFKGILNTENNDN